MEINSYPSPSRVSLFEGKQAAGRNRFDRGIGGFAFAHKTEPRPHNSPPVLEISAGSRWEKSSCAFCLHRSRLRRQKRQSPEAIENETLARTYQTTGSDNPTLLRFGEWCCRYRVKTEERT